MNGKYKIYELITINKALQGEFGGPIEALSFTEVAFDSEEEALDWIDGRGGLYTIIKTYGY